MSVAVAVDTLLAYSDHERRRWHDWFAADAGRMAIPFQVGARFPTIGALLDHIFLVERRHLSRLQGATPPDATGVTPGDWRGLFDYGDLVRSDFRTYVGTLTDATAGESISFTVQPGAFSAISGTFTMTRRKLATHILLHEIRHFAQIAYAARVAGHAPPGQHDLFFFPEP